MINPPSFITNDYINRTLDLLEERLNSSGNSKAISCLTTMTGQLPPMSSAKRIFSVNVGLMIIFLILSPTVSVHAQNISSQIAQWFVPLDLGKQLKIQCNGSVVEFVSDLTSPANCKSLRLVANDTLECLPYSQFKANDEQVIFP